EQDEREKKREEQERVQRANKSYEENCARVKARGFKVEDVEKIMKDKGIGNYDTAMEFLENQARLAPPTPDSLGHTMSMPTEQKDIEKNQKKWSLNAMHAAVDELQRMRPRA